MIERERAIGRRHVLDPFAGSGTVLLESERAEVESFGLEAHPFVFRVAEAKLAWREEPTELSARATTLLLEAARHEPALCDRGDDPALLEKCFTAPCLRRLKALHQAWLAQDDGSPLSKLLWLALTSILRSCSPVGTAQWQYVLPKKSKAGALDPYQAFRAKIDLMATDMAARHLRPHGPEPSLLLGDARQSEVPEGWADLVITSPPYANNYDYADATRLEMSFFGEVRGWGGLQNAVRRHLVRSCTQHVAADSSAANAYLEDPLLAPVREEMVAVTSRLAAEKDSHAGRKPYDVMVQAYFYDMARVWQELRRVTRAGSLVCFVVGDSAPYGVYVPVDRWLGELALAAGFQSYEFEKTRDRNVKWKNRKHRVPLHEGMLWVEG